MNKLAVLIVGLLLSLTANANLSFQEIRTASKDILVVFFKSDTIDMDEVDISNPSQWKLNGKSVKSINKFVTESNKCDHYIYLGVPDLVNGSSYTLETPYGTFSVYIQGHRYFLRVHKNQSGWIQCLVGCQVRQLRNLDW
jgi:hypothetical protein